MKRYRDCAIYCIKGQSKSNLISNIETEANNCGYKSEKYTSFSSYDSLSVYVRYENLPYSKIVICQESSKDCVSVVNIVPMPESGVSHLEPTIYNEILEAFINSVFNPIKKLSGNRIESNAEDFTIQDIIPLSYPRLYTWLHGYPLTSHPNDTHRWYDFVLSLHRNDEHLSLDVFGKYLEEECGWDEDIINAFELKLESQLDLLEYYDEHK